MSTDLRRTLGATGEDLAAAHLQRLGHTILARNHRTRYGELDIVSCSGDTLVFVEVKTRRQTRDGSPWDALHERKRMQVRRMASAYLSDVTERPRTRDIRFDAIGIVIDGQGALVRLDHLEAAF
jgi:putative endonuclease